MLAADENGGWWRIRADRHISFFAGYIPNELSIQGDVFVVEKADGTYRRMLNSERTDASGLVHDHCMVWKWVLTDDIGQNQRNQSRDFDTHRGIANHGLITAHGYRSSSSSTDITDGERGAFVAQPKPQTNHPNMDWRQTNFTTQLEPHRHFDSVQYDQVLSDTSNKAQRNISQERTPPARTWAKVLTKPPVVLDAPKTSSFVVLGRKRP